MKKWNSIYKENNKTKETKTNLKEDTDQVLDLLKGYLGSKINYIDTMGFFNQSILINFNKTPFTLSGVSPFSIAFQSSFGEIALHPEELFLIENDRKELTISCSFPKSNGYLKFSILK